MSHVHKHPQSSITAIIVTFNPNLTALLTLIDCLNKQLSSVVVIDNTPQKNSLLQEQQSSSKYTYISLSNNMGIAYAQNIGIEFAIKQNADYVLLLDQDSMPREDMIEQLLINLSNSKQLLPNVIAASPQYFDPRTNFQSLFMVSRFKIPFRYRAPQKILSNNVVLASFLISSGTLIDLPKLTKLRGMRSDYFIDHVDTEWCIRALANGYQLLGIHNAKMIHSLGDKAKKIWFFGMRNISEHSPLRDYYMFRNTLLMLRDLKMPPTWRIFLLFRLVEFFVFFLIFSQERILRFRLMLLGLKHGLGNIRGRLDLQTFKCNSIPVTPLDPT